MVFGLSVILIFSILSWNAGSGFPGGFEEGRDGAEYAGIARHIVRDGCFHTDAIYPLYLFFDFIDSAKIADGHPVPQLNRQPAFPLYLAAAFRLFGISEHTAEAAAFLPIIAVACLLLYAGGKYFNFETGFSAALLYLSHPNVVRNGVKTLSEPLAALLLLLIILLLTGISRSKSRIPFIVFPLGILSGSLALIKLPMAVILPISVAAVFFSGTRRSGALVAWSLTFALLLLPWLMRNAIITGNPFFTIQSYCEVTKYLPGAAPYEAHRSLEPVTILQAAANNPIHMGKAFLRGIAITSAGTIRMIAWLLPFVVIRSILKYVSRGSSESIKPGFTWKIFRKICGRTGNWTQRTPGSGPVKLRNRNRLFRDNTQSRFAVLSLFVLAANGSIYSILSPDQRHLLPVLPLIILSALGLHGWKFPVNRKLIIPASILAALLNLAILSRIIAPGVPSDPKIQKTAEEITELTRIEGPIISDWTTSLSWFLDRSVIWLPVDKPTLQEICSRTNPAAVFLSESIRNDFLLPFGGRKEIETQILELGFEPARLTNSGNLYIKPPE